MKIKGAFTAAALAASLLAVPAPVALGEDSAPLSTADCEAPALFNPLTGFGDARNYFVAPGGDFDGGADGWSLQGGATLGPADGPLDLGANSGSLKLPAGATATSPTFCVDLDYPTFRFFAAQAAAKATGALQVDVIYPAIDPKTTEARSMTNLGADWTLTKDVPLKPKVADKAGGWRLVAIRFRATATEYRVDDLLVDPRMRG